MYLKPLVVWNSLNTNISPTVSQNCNVFATFVPTLDLSKGSSQTFLNYFNECPFPVIVEIDNIEQLVVDGFEFTDPKVYIAPFSPMRQNVRCVFSPSATANFTASTSETATIDLTCTESDVYATLANDVEVPLVGSVSGVLQVSRRDITITANEITPNYVPYPVSEVSNGEYTTSTCTTTTTTPEHKHLSAAPLWNYLQGFKSAIGLPVLSKHHQTSTATCGFEDIRSDPDYVSRVSEFDQFGEVLIEFSFPYLSTIFPRFSRAFPDGQIYPYQRFPISPAGTAPRIPTSQAYDVIATLWRDYQGLGDFGTLTRGDDLIIQWTDLKISDDAVVSTQLTLHANGDFKIRTGRCQGDDFGLLDTAVIGYQATDGSGQQLYRTLIAEDPCNVAIDFALNYQMAYVEQFVSDWFDVDPLNAFSAGASSTIAPTSVNAIEYGELVPPPQGEVQYYYDGILQFGTTLSGYYPA